LAGARGRRRSGERKKQTKREHSPDHGAAPDVRDSAQPYRTACKGDEKPEAKASGAVRIT